MAQIVRIAPGTHVPGVNNIGDIVEIVEDDVVLGPAYSTFRVDRVASLTRAEIEAVLKVEIADVFAVPTDSAKEWTFTPPVYKKVWNDAGVWRELADHPKYLIGLNLSAADIIKLADSRITKADKLAILAGKRRNNIAGKQRNNTTVNV